MNEFVYIKAVFPASVKTSGRRSADVLRDGVRVRVELPQGLKGARPGKFLKVREVAVSPPVVASLFEGYDEDRRVLIVERLAE